MFGRRELLKALPALIGTPLMVKGQEVGKAFKIEPDAKYVVFINAGLIDPNDFCEQATGLPEGTAVHSVVPSDGMDEVIRIYKTK